LPTTGYATTDFRTFIITITFDRPRSGAPLLKETRIEHTSLLLDRFEPLCYSSRQRALGRLILSVRGEAMTRKAIARLRNLQNDDDER
jgi:hypothetical protein